MLCLENIQHGEDSGSDLVGHDSIKKGEPWRAKKECAWLSGDMGRTSLPGRGSTLLCLRGKETSMTPPPEEVWVLLLI